MNTRSVIEFFQNGVVITNETRTPNSIWIRSRPRAYYFEKMTPTSFKRLVDLSDHSQAIIKLLPLYFIKQLHAIVIWKRENDHTNIR